MTEATHHPAVTRHCDVAVVGGSAAGLAAALQLARQRRSVIVVDSGQPRNAPAANMHGYLGREGDAPSELVATGRREVRRYGGEILRDEVTSIGREGDRFTLRLAGSGATVAARRVLAATGLVDELPEIDGLGEHWGEQVIHCPFCHGYEVRDRRVVQIVTHPMGLHPSAIFAHLTDQLSIVLHGVENLDLERLAALRAAGVTIYESPARRVVSSDGVLTALELADGIRLEADAVAIGPRFHVRAEAFASLGLTPEPHPSGMGDVVGVDERGETSVPGLYAAGNVADPTLQVLNSAAAGSRTGAMIAFELAEAGLRDAARMSGHRDDWDARYSGEQIWSGNPNGTLVAEMSDATPGRALDVGAGEGGDAVWLAERGWTVTASDISQRALDRIDAFARERNLKITGLLADANDHDAFADTFDLVTAHYASIPRTADDRAVGNLISAVAPGGTLLVVGHDLPASDAPVDHPRHFDADAYVSVADVAAAITKLPDWTVVVDELRERPAGSATGHLHPHDVVFRAKRD